VQHCSAFFDDQPVEVVLITKRNSLEVWVPATTKDQFIIEAPTKLVNLNPSMERDSPLLCSALSSDGQFIATSNGFETKIWGLSISRDSIQVSLVGIKPGLKRARDQPRASLPGAVKMQFSGRKLILVTFTAEVHVIEIPSLKVIHVFPMDTEVHTQKNKKKHQKDSDQSKPSTDLLIVNSKWIVCGDTSNTIKIFSSATFQLHCEIPPPKQFHTSAAFLDDDTLVVALVTSLILFDLNTKKSIRRKINFPEVILSKYHDSQARQIRGVSVHPVRDYFVVYGLSWVCQMTRKESDGQLVFRKDGMNVACSFSETDLIVVEYSKLQAVKDLPLPFKKHQFGRAV